MIRMRDSKQKICDCEKKNTQHKKNKKENKRMKNLRNKCTVH